MISDVERRWGVHWAMGGTGALVRGLVDLIEGQGGCLRLQADVERIEVEGGVARGVRLVTGERIESDIVVSNADAAFTYKRLLPAAARKRWTDRRLDAATYSMGLFVWYFGTRKRFDDVAHHTILVGPRYRGHVNEIFAARSLPKDMSLYLHRPTATDPALAPPSISHSHPGTGPGSDQHGHWNAASLTGHAFCSWGSVPRCLFRSRGA